MSYLLLEQGELTVRQRLMSIFIFLHAASILISPEWLLPFNAVTIYGPLMLFDALHWPVFGTAQSWGWAAPSLLGWAMLLLIWAAIYFAIASLIVFGIKAMKVKHE